MCCGYRAWRHGMLCVTALINHVQKAQAHRPWRSTCEPVVGLGRGLLDALSQAGAQAHLEVVDGDVIQHRVRPCQVDVLKDAGVDLPRGALLGDELALLCIRL